MWLSAVQGEPRVPVPAPRHVQARVRRTHRAALPVQALQGHVLDADVSRRLSTQEALARPADLPADRLEGHAAAERADPALSAGDRRTAARELRQVLRDLPPAAARSDRKSTRLNSSHVEISYAVFCLNKKTTCILRIS